MLKGRLVLADALHYTETRFAPQAMVNLATLTGAIIASLGKEYGGLFSNSDDLASQLASCRARKLLRYLAYANGAFL